MSDIVMVAQPSTYSAQKTSHTTVWLSAHEFWNKEVLVQSHDVVLWKAFHTHGKYQRTVRKADWFSVAVSENGDYLASAFVVEISNKWIIEYVMTDPTRQGKGIGSAVMNRIMEEAQKSGVEWVILNCDSNVHNGQLPTFYRKFGFVEAPQ